MLSLLKGGADYKIKDKWNRTPSEAAKEHGETEISEIITSFIAGTYVAKDESKPQPVPKKSGVKGRKRILSKIMEAPLSTEKFLGWLKEDDIDILGCDMYKWTALHKLASWNKSQCIEAMLSDPRVGEENISKKGQGGDTPLHCAIEMHASASVDVLLKDERVKKNINALNDKGLTPADVAVNSGNTSALSILKDLGAVCGSSGGTEKESHLPEHYGKTEKRPVKKLNTNKFAALAKAMGKPAPK
mmetsp:Transcript_20668/g.22961  ORF Transcript_20668/g.22961 Transcript_20668/m.22961 type:complete len:245 (+) Transcript_20668:1325-2059(+)